ncbi:AIG2-like protein [Wickerhamomyces ciferrii]|uniref:Putative gamma-glutamylcyclotransferase n=1 Tax=Wickerhamomyces ciferrii (strain ATCC 14091 / BCRC 22168 / CBS 111 / JCM 3599 / NBRC 0793 / NRRL Y-1031 F-60-10) TaxID=1206466 RepID=K0KSN8_WICCF|nr:AIG2-like protein [Wickerhamomyces ciferrii]CCH44369.1 AIG2-like protein [Wickerhamomyces ciferrii]
MYAIVSNILDIVNISQAQNINIVSVYGTLASYEKLYEVLQVSKDTNQYKITHFGSAILKDYKKYNVLNEVYPGVIKSKGGDVFGSLIYGLTPKDFELLDEYEGDEYERNKAKVIFEDKLIDIQFYEWIDDHSKLVPHIQLQ